MRILAIETSCDETAISIAYKAPQLSLEVLTEDCCPMKAWQPDWKYLIPL